MNLKPLKTLLLFSLIGFTSCKKESIAYNKPALFPPSLIDTIPTFLDNDFENTIFKSNLKNINLSTFPDELQLGGGDLFYADGISLNASKVFQMKYPSTLDKSQIIIDLQFTPKISYTDKINNNPIDLSEIKKNNIPFNATMHDTKIYVGKSLMSIAGTVFSFNVNSEYVFLELYKLTSGSSSSTIDDNETTTTAKIPLHQFLGDVNVNFWEKFNLRLTITKDVNFNHLKVENAETGAIIECYGKSKKQSNGCQWGYGFIRPEQSNTIKIQQFIYRSLDPLSPRVLFLGHSFIEGNSLSDTPEGYNARYAAIIKEKLNGNAIIAGMGGAKSANIVNRLKMDLEPFSPKYVVIDCIANENSEAEWRNNMSIIINKVLEKNAIPILVTAAPRSGYENVITPANNYIRNNLNYQYIDLNNLVSINKSSNLWKSNYAMPDGVHPSVMAHHEIALLFFEQIKEMFIN